MSLVIGLKNKIFRKLYNVFFLSKKEEELYNYYNKTINDNSNSKNIVLIQCVENYFYFAVFGEVIKSFNKDNSIRVEQYIPRNLTLGATSNFGSFLKSILLNNSIRDKKWIKLYSSYADSVAYSHENSTSFLHNIKYFVKAYKIFANLKDKHDLLSLIINEVKVGDLIYDSYLRFKPASTVDIRDLYLIIVIWQCIRNIEMTNKYFVQNKPKVLLTSYSSYIQHGIAVRIAMKFDTKVYSFGNNQSIAKELTINDIYHTANFNSYKNNFELFSREDKEIYLEESKTALDNRIKGMKDISTSYMKESAYKISDDIKIPNVKNHIVIFLHDFFDSPHIYGDMVFPDFLEWIEFTINLLEKENIPYSLKPHPNQIGDSEKVIKMLKVEYPKANFISSKITNKQLVNAGMCTGISVYGTVAYELVYMNIPVILCGENPHSSYNFVYEAKNEKEYVSYIKNHRNLKLNKKSKEEVLSFYYMHNLNKSRSEIRSLDYISSFRNYSNENRLDFNEYKSFLGNFEKNKTFTNIIKV
tara:strand:+ start:7314 stop:8897 length:1584 start_codon:yes stop_codon:yes gene_type:complete